MISEELNKLIVKYIRLIVWFSCNESSKDIPTDIFCAVLNQIEKIEDKLALMGVCDECMHKINMMAEVAMKRSLSEMTPKLLEMVVKSTFGGKTKIEN